MFKSFFSEANGSIVNGCYGSDGDGYGGGGSNACLPLPPPAPPAGPEYGQIHFHATPPPSLYGECLSHVCRPMLVGLCW